MVVSRRPWRNEGEFLHMLPASTMLADSEGLFFSLAFIDFVCSIISGFLFIFAEYIIITGISFSISLVFVCVFIVLTYMLFLIMEEIRN